MIGGLLSLAGIVALWRSWLRPHRFWPGLILGWGLIAAALPFWARRFGADRGAAMAILAVSLIGLVLIALTNRRTGPDRPATGGGALPKVDWRWLIVFLLAGPAGLALSIGGELLYAAHGPGPQVDRLVFGLLLTPCFWALAMILAASDYRRRFVAALLHSHSVLGLAFSAVLYLVCLSGMVTVFAHDIDRWRESAWPTYQRLSPEAIDRAAHAAFDLHPKAPRLFLVLPTGPAPHMTILTGDQEYRTDEEGDILGPAPKGWGEFVTDLHVRLHVKGIWGVSLVGLCGVGLTALIISGLLAHPRIFRDAFRWRRGGNLRTARADLHNRIGVWGAPLFLALALSGAFLGLAQLLLPANADALLYGKAPVPSEEAAPLADLTGPLKFMAATHPDDVPHYAEIDAPGTVAQAIRLYYVPPDRLVYSERYDFDASGKLTSTLGMKDGEIGRQVFASLYPVHFGSFGGGWMRVIYGLLGLGLSAVCASGVDIWLARKKISGWPARVWPGVAWGVPALLTLTMLTVPSPFLFWGGLAVLLAVLAAAKSWSAAKITRTLRAVTAFLLIAAFGVLVRSALFVPI